MQSHKNVFNQNVNSTNLMFITGPTKSGKSMFVKDEMQNFANETKLRPVVFHFDFEEHSNSMVSFDCFLSRFEAMLI